MVLFLSWVISEGVGEKMLEKKLRMAVPDWKWLIHPNRWSVADILRKAGVGEYTIDESRGDATFLVSPQLLGVEVVKPRRMPSEIVGGDYDCGITARDCFKNAHLSNLDELIDLGCGYVDLVFMTNSERWNEVEKRMKEEKSKIRDLISLLKYPSLGKLDRFLIYYGMLDKKVVCASEYHNIADDFLLLKQKELSQYTQFQYSVKESRNDTESCLFSVGDDRADIIFETMATGEHSSEKGLEILEIADNSTTRLYSKSHLKNPTNDVEKWKKEQNVLYI